MIAGGPTDGDSERARRAHARAARSIMEIDEKMSVGAPIIQFGPADTQGVHLPHNDVLVIFATVANYTIQRILLNQVALWMFYSIKYTNKWSWEISHWSLWIPHYMALQE
ncbi:UNVERIFIED_CONTAM: hypothetical protein Slati_3936700 [Sesamum latifolium]|uniref:Uncharacterized protein n=1 Tax=Sesamum latifolium TaxID=2727402 RepID=A0AAW2TMQ9_9LAMI